jgi:hypothetical protein
MYKEMHKITDIVKKWSSLFFIRGNAHRNDIKTGHISE